MDYEKMELGYAEDKIERCLEKRINLIELKESTSEKYIIHSVSYAKTGLRWAFFLNGGALLFLPTG